MTLQESLLKNIKQTDNDVRQMYIDWINIYGETYFKRKLVEGVDYTLSKSGVLDFLPAADGETLIGSATITNSGTKDMMFIGGMYVPTPPSGLKFGRLQCDKHKKHPVGLGFRFLDISKIEDVVADTFCSEYIHFKFCGLPKKLDLSKFDLDYVTIDTCPNLEELKLPRKKMSKLDLSKMDSLKRIVGCEEVDEIFLNRVHGGLKLPKKVNYTLFIQNSHLWEYDQLPKFAQAISTYNSTVHDKPLTKKRLEGYCEYKVLRVKNKK